jgi:hypothetical protein
MGLVAREHRGESRGGVKGGVKGDVKGGVFIAVPVRVQLGHGTISR